MLEILGMVREEGDKSLFKLTEKFDGVRLEDFVVTKKEIDEAYESIDRNLFKAIKFAKKNIEKFHDKIFMSERICR